MLNFLKSHLRIFFASLLSRITVFGVYEGRASASNSLAKYFMISLCARYIIRTCCFNFYDLSKKLVLNWFYCSWGRALLVIYLTEIAIFNRGKSDQKEENLSHSINFVIGNPKLIDDSQTTFFSQIFRS